MMMKCDRRGRVAASLLALAATLAPALVVPTPAFAQSAADLQALATADPDDAPDAGAVGDTSPAREVQVAQAGEQGDGFYCGERRLGQWFYCDKPKPAPKAAPAPGAPATGQSYAQRIAAIGEALKELKAKAILEPSEENIMAYVRFQREQLDRASTFSDYWQRAVWQHPDLDYTLQRPVSTVAKRAWSDGRTVDRDRVLDTISQRYGMFYFFAQSCAACEVFSPILRSVADSHHMAVMAVSTDGGPSKTFPNYVVDSGQRARMGVPLATPALVLFDTVTHRTVPIGFGIMSADEVMDRIFTLTATKVGSDY
ncbi:MULTISPECIES: conjugal transfer protein TraF [unclassified Sphingomonas]|uniref:conjugal transfer protein TraF n=1 Tax=unclassified Sphingomonas TaxID=196159 RepID=UPI002269C267|nr:MULTISPECIES: conjugal transfer protein TraF [unclassified Sphingomonas]